MTSMTRFILILAAACFLAGCAPDPRSVADAERTRLIAVQEAADMEAARAARLAADELRQAEAVKYSAARVIAWRVVLIVAGVAGGLAVLGLAVGFAWAMIGAGRGVSRLAGVRASLVPLSESTRQYPLMLSYIGQGRFALVNPNSGAVYELDSRCPGDRQLISISGAVQLAGVVAREARRSVDPGGVILAVNPTVVQDD